MIFRLAKPPVRSDEKKSGTSCISCSTASAFCTRLEEIRSIRNKVMHFHPDGISDEDREILRKTRQMLQGL